MPDYANPWHQCGMILDRPRVDKYAAAIAQTVKPGDVVMDIGSGSGLLALLAARAGATKVYAIERTAAADFVRAHAAENGFSDVIEVIQVDFNETPKEVLAELLVQKPNVVIAELLGNFAPDEGQHEAFQRARELVRPGAVFLPSSYALLFVPSCVDYLASEARALSNVHGIRLSHLAGAMRAWPMLRRVRPGDLAGPEVEGWRGKTTDDACSTLAVRLPITTSGVVNSVVCTFTATLAEGVELTTSVFEDETSWQSAVFPFAEPIACAAGDTLTFHLRVPDVAWPETWTWNAERVRAA